MKLCRRFTDYCTLFNMMDYKGGIDRLYEFLEKYITKNTIFN